MVTIPDRWLLFKVTDGNEWVHKVFASWSGGYLTGDEWQANSGIVSCHVEGDYYCFIGKSGSIYKCRVGAYGSNVYGWGIIKGLEDKHPDKCVILSEYEAFEYISTLTEEKP